MKREDNPRKFKMKPLQGKMGIRHQVSQRCFNLIFVINDDKKKFGILNMEIDMKAESSFYFAKYQRTK